MTGKRDLPSGTVTFLFSDMEGSTRLLKQLGRDRYGELLSAHNALLREAFTANGGIEIDRQGDAFFFVFRSAGTAVAAAAAAQRGMHSHEWPDDTPVRVRIGLHTGEASVSGEGYVGFAVHQAARIGDLGHGGQILVSRTTAALIEHELQSGMKLRALGETRVPGLDPPEAIFQLDFEGLAHRFPPVGAPRPDARPAPPPPSARASLPPSTGGPPPTATRRSAHAVRAPGRRSPRGRRCSSARASSRRSTRMSTPRPPAPAG